MATTGLADGRATSINLFSLKSPPMRAFHVTWLAFFLAFFGWFGVAPLMIAVRDDLGLTRAQVGNTIIASVAVTVVARLVIGWLADRLGPRVTYSWLLVLGSIPVMLIGTAQNYETFLLLRLAIGVVGASFVLTQFHTSLMFAPNVVGTANATTAGWGNLGGGVTQLVMPVIMTAIVAMGFSEALGWRIAMVVPGAALFFTGIAYYFLTQDTPRGNFKDLRRRGEMPPASQARGTFLMAARDYRVWALFVIYGACFGIELTINNVAALYYYDRFGLSAVVAGGIAALFGLMNVFARTLGGVLGDRAGIKFGLRGRVALLGAVLLFEGLALMLFSRMSVLGLAVGTMIVFSILVQMAEGATYSVVPFINRKALGAVAGIVGAGGNAGAVSAGFLFRIESLPEQGAFLILGAIVAASSGLVFFVRFSREAEAEERETLRRALRERSVSTQALPPVASEHAPVAAMGVGGGGNPPLASGPAPTASSKTGNGDRKAALRMFTYGLYAMTVPDGATVHGATVNWVTQTSFDPPMLSLSVEKGSRSLELVRSHGVFAINVFGHDQIELAGRLGRNWAKAPNKSQGVQFEVRSSGTPLLSEALGYVECRVVREVDSGDSVVLVGEVVDGAQRHDGVPLTMAASGFRHAG